MKVTPVVKIDEIIQVEDGFFRIEKQEIKDDLGRKYSRFFLKTVISPKKMKTLKKYIELTTPNTGKETK